MRDFNHPGIAKALLEDISRKAEKAGPVRIMEVCGTHTMAIGRFGLRKLLPKNVRLISGPGCPVCVTPAGYIDNAVSIAVKENLTIATFGDMMRVPGIKTSLEKARTDGINVKVIISPAEILSMKGPTLFLAVGFETTAAPIAATMELVAEKKNNTIFFYTSLKVIPPTLKILLSDPEIGIESFILPGHVSTIIGVKPYGFLTVPSVIAGFEMIDILQAILIILEMRIKGKTGVMNNYKRVVHLNGNPKARDLIGKYFESRDEHWRGLGALPGCSLGIKEKYSRLDAKERFNLKSEDDAMPKGCACGNVLKGKIMPKDCALFGKKCTPDNPVGPCMVSSEGACAAYYKYKLE